MYATRIAAKIESTIITVRKRPSEAMVDLLDVAVEMALGTALKGEG